MEDNNKQELIKRINKQEKKLSNNRTLQRVINNNLSCVKHQQQLSFLKRYHHKWDAAGGGMTVDLEARRLIRFSGTNE